MEICISCNGKKIKVQLDHSGECRMETLVSREENTVTIKVQPITDHGQVSYSVCGLN